MPARTGEAYMKGLQEHPREVWIDGERVEDVTTHPALRHGVRSVAALYDMQHDPALREGSCTSSLRIIPPDSPVDCHKV